MIKIGVITMALMSFLHAGWLGDLFDSTPTPYYKMPIDLSKAGNVAETDIRIDEKHYVYVMLSYDPREQKISRDRYGEISDKYFGDEIKPTLPIFPIKLTVMKYEKTGTTVIVDKIYHTNTQRASATRHIDEFKLQEGAKYHIKVEAVEDYPELADLNVEVVIGYIKAK
ncbi:MAG: hypothetical protein A3K14_01300 [Sulfurimonas sp. RIFCSPLOWO2_12_FULL_36_74]|nr:MAG: hypothetical protein A3J26_03035 [Sulfurimonas sp. RIFCSPLOWO2_02_FULL_36_28]OHE03064.1 MAG: hypothetical protein A3K14_01300 [Sulfurimonas sp. RIFCSPLOWO2_12_FULL_36_74]